MTQAERDRLVTLRKTKKGLITRRQAAEELGLSVRQVKRVVKALRKRGDKAVIHGLCGQPSRRRIDEAVKKEAVQILSADVYKGFRPTLAAEYLRKEHGITASKETVRQWMICGKLWCANEQKAKVVHIWRPRRSRFGELVRAIGNDPWSVLPWTRCAAVLRLWPIPASTTGWKGAERSCT